MPRVTLSDKYDWEHGRIFLTGIQALVRLPLMQRRLDIQAGHDTAGFISGYRGSPLGGLDLQLGRAKAVLDRHRVVFQPGINEDLAATAVWGTQHVGLFERATCDGVFALWYGKSPGVDRSGDAFKHANFAGTAPLGGVLAVAGDDHACKSSTLPNQSEFAFIDAEMPILAPADVAETLEFGLFGWALSRACGAWVAMKALADTMDSTAVVDLDALRTSFDSAPKPESPPRGLHIREQVSALECEEVHRRWRLPAAQTFALANGIDRIILDSTRPRLGIVASGKAYLLVRQALLDLGIDDRRADELGIRLLKIGMSWPLVTATARRFAQGLEEILVVEERRSVLEPQLKSALYGAPAAPRVVGKTDPEGRPLISDLADLDVSKVMQAIASRLRVQDRSTELLERLSKGAPQTGGAASAGPARVPFYCSGCPHNTSTTVPEGSRAIAGIGCHYLATRMPRRTGTPTHMGAEGVPWIGQAPFTTARHVFTNLGDGTYFHSGLLAIRWALGAKVNITYKILFNGAIAMTGGQRVEGELTVPRIAAQLRAEGVQRIAIVSDMPDTHQADALIPPGVTFHHRRELESLQRELRECPGVSALIYDQLCATEKRRLRKRHQLPAATRRVFINDRVCEGCGDCSTKSNCLSIEPVDTAFGRKRQVNQSSCNADFSCAEGFCPSFVSVEGGQLRRPTARAATPAAALEPVAAAETSDIYNIIINGVGGLGVTSAAAILGMAAHLEDKNVRIVDTLGLAQKGGAVYSFMRIAGGAAEIHGARFGIGCADLLIAGDLVEASRATIAPLLGPDRTKAVGNTGITPTADIVQNSDIRYDSEHLQAEVGKRARVFEPFDATTLAMNELGDPIYANIIMLGFACQRGWLPVGSEAIERALELNGETIEENKRAFALGRRVAGDHAHTRQSQRPAPSSIGPSSLNDSIECYVADLERYQNARYAAGYRELVEKVRAAEQRSTPGETRLTEAVAAQYFRLLAYKDEYEVARLFCAPEFSQALEQRFAGRYRLRFHLSPPLFARRDPTTGEPRKYQFGPWLLPVFRLLARLRFLRGTWLDPFGWTQERRMERALARQYRADIESLIVGLSSARLSAAVELASLPAAIRGYGHIKAARMEQARGERERILRTIA